MSSAGAGITWPHLRRLRLDVEGGGFVTKESYESDGTQKNLRISVHTRQTIQAASSVSIVNMWNLSSDSKAGFIRDETRVLISAGWDHGPLAGLTSTYKGCVLTSHHQRQGPDVITTIYLQSGKRAVSKEIIIDTFRAMPVRNAVLSIARRLKDVGVDEKRVMGIKGTFPEKGFPVCGTAEAILDSLSSAYGFHWTIENDLFLTVSKDPKDPEGGFEAGPTIMTPYLIEVNPIMVGIRQYQQGVQGTCLFNSAIRPGQYVTVESVVNKNCCGQWRVSSLEHDLDPYAQRSFITHFTALGRNSR